MADEIDAGRIVAEIVLETKQAQEAAEEITEELEELEKKKVSPTIIVDTKPAIDGVEELNSELYNASGKSVTPVIDIDTSQAKDGVEELNSELDNASGKSVTPVIDIDTSQAKDGVEELNSELDNASGKSVTPVIDIDTKPAADAIKETEQVIDKINTAEIKPKVDYETLSYIKGSLEEIGITGREMVDMLNAGFGNLTTAKRYRVALEDIALKIDECRTKMQASNIGDNIDSGALTQLEEQYDKILAKLDDYVAQTVSAVQKTREIENEINEFSGLNTSNSVDNSTMLQVQSYEDTIIYIKDVLADLKITGKEADKIINACFQDVSGLRKYQNQLQILADKLELARTRYQELAQAKAVAEKQGNTADVDKMTMAMENQAVKIKSLEAQFDNTYSQMDSTVKKSVNNYNKQANTGYKASKNFAGGVNLATTSLRALNSVAPDAVDGIGQIITQVNAAKQAMTVGASASLAWGTAIIAGISIVMNLVINEIQKAVDAENEAREKSAEAQKSIAKNYLQDISSAKSAAKEKEATTAGEIGLLKSLQSEYDELRTKTSLTAEEQKELDNIASQIAETMGTTTQALKDQSGAYKVLTSSIEDYIEQLRNKAQIESMQGVLKEAYKVEFEVSEESVKEARKAYDDYLQEIWDKLQNNVTFNAYVKAGTAPTDKEQLSNRKDIVDLVGGDYEKLNRLRNTWADLFNQRDNALDTIEKYEKEIEEFYSKFDNSEKKVANLSSAMSDLSSAYKTVADGGELDSNTLQNLINQYPELASYISQTGDLTLQNGEKIKEAYEKERQALIKQLNDRKSELELEMKSSDSKEKIANQISVINAQLAIYNSERYNIDNDEWSNVAGDVKELASAYQTLNEGKSLDIDTTIALIDKYPEVATAMANAGKLGKEQANVFKELAEAKKNDYIVSQQVALKNLEVSKQETEGIIQNLMAQISVYMFRGQVMQAMNVLPQLASQNANWNNINNEINKVQARIKAIKSIDINTYGTSGSGSGSDSNTALANELKQLEHKKALGQLTSKQEYDWLVRINNKYSKNADEQMDMEKRLYNAKKQMQADEEAANTKALQEAYKGIENKKSLGKMTSQQELQQLEQIRQKYKMTAEERMELEIKIYNLKKSLKDDEISSLNTLADAVTQALKEKYEEQRKLEEERINDSIESWQEWEDKTVAAIQGEIDALDELADKQESENKRQEYENKRQQTELQLAYEKDDYNRTQLQKELNRLDKEEAERLAEEQREAQKKILQGRIEAVKGQSQATQERLKDELDEIGEKYDKLTDSFSLKAQAQKFIANSTQQQIVNLIKSYASDYEIAGNTIGDALYNGMKSKLGDLEAYVDGIFGKIEAYQRQVANTANAAADKFWKEQSQTQTSKSVSQPTSAPKSVTVNQTVNFNQPVESPVEVRRQLDRTNQALAQQISSGI